MASPRIYLTGHLGVEHGPTLMTERHLPGRQGRLALAYLVLHRHAPVDRADFEAALWGDAPPPEVDAAINALLSKLRQILKKCALDAGIEVRAGTLTLRLPPDVRVDVEDAAAATDAAEGALRREDRAGAWGHANVAVVITRRPLLPNEDAPWLEARRQKLRTMLARSLSVLAQVSAANGEPELAVQYATEVIELEPFRETAYQQLMRLHAQMGNRGEALRVFGRLRALLRDELGASPSPQSDAVFREILTA